MTVRAASALSTHPTSGDAVAEAAKRVAEELGATPDVAVLFCSPHHARQADVISLGVRTLLDPRTFIGCTGESIVGDGREVEAAPALSLWAATLPGSTVESFHSTFVRTGEGQQGFAGFPDPAARSDVRAVVMLADPFTYPAHALLRAADDRWAFPFVGGMASGSGEAGGNRLFRDGDVHDAGAVGVLLSGDVPLRTVVSQGCRPIGEPFVITRGEGNMLHELGGRPALERLQEVLATAAPDERELFRNGPQIGVVIDEYKDSFGRGDFLIRGVLGADPETGAVAIGEPVAVGRTVQFHVRDAATADEDLRALLGGVDSASGALLFTCNGRGSRLFTQPDHDVTAIRDALGEIPVAGFFCQGEIGPVGPQSFLHGFTASAAFFG